MSTYHTNEVGAASVPESVGEQDLDGFGARPSCRDHNVLEETPTHEKHGTTKGKCRKQRQYLKTY